jgi:hypothetical protein
MIQWVPASLVFVPWGNIMLDWQLRMEILLHILILSLEVLALQIVKVHGLSWLGTVHRNNVECYGSHMIDCYALIKNKIKRSYPLWFILILNQYIIACWFHCFYPSIHFHPLTLSLMLVSHHCPLQPVWPVCRIWGYCRGSYEELYLLGYSTT